MDKEITFYLQKTVYVESNRIALNEICSINGTKDKKYEDIVFDIKRTAGTITAFDVFVKLSTTYPDHTINNIGPPECNVFIKEKKQKKTVAAIKVIFLCLVMFFGGAIAIMTFHEDVDMRSVHSAIYYFFTGIEQNSVPIVSLPYSAGIAIGFIFLFGLYKRKSKKPTVLEIDMNEHENAMRSCMTDIYKDNDG